MLFLGQVKGIFRGEVLPRMRVPAVSLTHSGHDRFRGGRGQENRRWSGEQSQILFVFVLKTISVNSISASCHQTHLQGLSEQSFGPRQGRSKDWSLILIGGRAQGRTGEAQLVERHGNPKATVTVSLSLPHDAPENDQEAL